MLLLFEFKKNIKIKKNAFYRERTVHS